MAKSMAKSRKHHSKTGTRKTRNLRHHKKSKRGKKVAKKTKRKSKLSKKSHRRRHRRSSRYNIKGGSSCAANAGAANHNPSGFSLVPSAISDIGRSVQYGALGAYAATGGNDPPINPLPYQDQLNGGNLPDDIMLRA
jgi:hypothetical protein